MCVFVFFYFMDVFIFMIKAQRQEEFNALICSR